MQYSNQVSPIVNGNLWLVIQGSVNVLVIGFIVLSLDGVGRDIVLHQSRRRFILRTERVGGTENDIGSTLFQDQCQVGRFGSNMKASRNPDTG